MSNHDTQMLHGKPIMHSTLVRDFLCGVCGGNLTTTCDLNHETRRCEWKTVCAADPTHDTQAFIHTNAAARRQGQALLEHLEAREIFRHLPKELQESILANQ